MDSLGISLLLWIVCGTVAAWVADTRKDPHPGTWAAMGFLLGPIGLLLAIVVVRDRRT